MGLAESTFRDTPAVQFVHIRKGIKTTRRVTGKALDLMAGGTFINTPTTRGEADLIWIVRLHNH